MQDHLTCENEEKQEEEEEKEIIEKKVSFFKCFSRTRGTKKIHPAVQCGGRYTSDVQLAQNKFCTLKHQEKCKQIKIWNWLKKINFIL